MAGVKPGPRNVRVTPWRRGGRGRWLRASRHDGHPAVSSQRSAVSESREQPEASYKLQAASCKLQAASSKPEGRSCEQPAVSRGRELRASRIQNPESCIQPQAASRKPQAASREPRAPSQSGKPQATSHKLRAASHEPRASSIQNPATSLKPQASSLIRADSCGFVACPPLRILGGLGDLGGTPISLLPLLPPSTFAIRRSTFDILCPQPLPLVSGNSMEYDRHGSRALSAFVRPSRTGPWEC